MKIPRIILKQIRAYETNTSYNWLILVFLPKYTNYLIVITYLLNSDNDKGLK